MASPRSRRESADYYRDRRRRKVCNFCVDKAESIDYKEVNRLRRYLSERAKIEPRRKTGTCARHQRMLTTALKRARHVALLPYAPQHLRPSGSHAAGPLWPAVSDSDEMPLDLLLALSGLLAGAFGALLGLGGGVLIVPILTLGFGLPLTAAIGTSLICVIATSTGAAAMNVRAGRADVRLGVTLGAGTAVGALSGGLLAGYLPERLLAGLFAAMLVYTALTMMRGLLRSSRSVAGEAPIDPTAPDGPSAPSYRTHRLPLAITGAFGGGNLSGLLGVGGGIVTVPIIHLLMRAPMQVAVTTSNFMIGITAAAGSYAYLLRGDIDARVAAPVVLGVAIGGVAGAALSARLRTSWLVVLFVLVLGYVAWQMAQRAIAG